MEGQHGTASVGNRKKDMIKFDRCSYDYYVKGMDADIRTGLLYTRMRLDINGVIIGYLTEKPEGYPSFYALNVSDEDIIRVEELYVHRFMAVNEVFMSVGRPPLFADPSDTYACALRYRDLLKKKTEEELIKEFGCSYDDYVPVEISCDKK